MTDPDPVGHLLLQGIVGSTAYGMAGPDSDIDMLGVYAHRTADRLGLNMPAETVTTTAPDVTLHEVGKWIRLALSCNPTVTELVWLPDNLYRHRTPIGDWLIDMRNGFLSAPRVRDAYLGYATSQFRRLIDRGDGSFSADTRRRTAKHARHLYRLCKSGYQLYAGGYLDVELADPQQVIDFGEQVAAGNTDLASMMLRSYEQKFDCRSCLPDQPRRDEADALLRGIRLNLLKNTPTT